MRLQLRLPWIKGNLIIMVRMMMMTITESFQKYFLFSDDQEMIMMLKTMICFSVASQASALSALSAQTVQEGG